jgi:NTE family protein
MRFWLTPREQRRERGLALALGGGGARGLAHVGVLAVLEEERLPVACVAGTSAGAIVGAMWLTLGSAAAVERRWRDFFASDFPKSLPDIKLADDVSSRDSTLLHFARTVQRGTTVALALGRRSLVEREDFARALAFLLPDVQIEELSRPFAAVATDFFTGQPVALRRGSLRLAVTASSSIPGVLPTCPWEGTALWDGGVVADVPVRQARELSRRPVVAVAVGDDPAEDDPELVKVPRALLRAGQLTHAALRQELLHDADLVLRPAVGGVHWSEFTRFEECLAAGRQAAQALLPQLRRLAERRAGR